MFGDVNKSRSVLATTLCVMPVSPAVKSADRVLDLFILLGRWGQEMTHNQIADRLAIPKGSLTPLLRTLMARGFIEYDHITRGYKLGPMFIELARHANDHDLLLKVVQPLLDKMTEQTGESSMLTKLSGNEGETVATVTGRHRLVSHMRVGDRGPLYATSGGKAILAHLPASMQDEYLARLNFEEIAPNTLRDVASLREELAEIRSTGISRSVEEFTIGIAGLGTPILAQDGYPLGAISVVLPVVRLNAQTRTSAEHSLREAAVDIARLLPPSGQQHIQELLHDE